MKVFSGFGVKEMVLRPDEARQFLADKADTSIENPQGAAIADRRAVGRDMCLELWIQRQVLGLLLFDHAGVFGENLVVEGMDILDRQMRVKIARNRA